MPEFMNLPKHLLTASATPLYCTVALTSAQFCARARARRRFWLDETALQHPFFVVQSKGVAVRNNEVLQ